MADGDPVFEARPAPMQTHAVNGAVATGVAQMVKLPFQAAAIVVLSRLLEPTDFGIYAMVFPLLSAALLLLDFGISRAVIQARALQRAEVSALFWVMCCAGLCVAAIMFACAPLITALYGEPRAGALFAAMSLFLVYGGVVNIPLALMNRQMKFGWLAVIDALGVAAGLIAGVAAANLGAHYWALALGYGATCVVTLLGVWLGVGWLPRDRRDFSCLLRFYKFGAALMLSESATQFARHADSVLIGRYAGPVQLGVYDRGNKLAIIPIERVSQLFERILLPILSRMTASPERYRIAYLRIIRQIMLFLVPGTVAAGVTAPVLVPLVLGDNWAPAAPILAWLALAALHQPVSMTMNLLFISQGRGRAYMLWSLFSAATSLIAFVIGLRWGALGVAAAFALSDIAVRAPFLWWCVTRRGPIRQADLYGAAAPFAAAAVAVAGALTPLQHLPYPNEIVQIAVSALAAYAVALAVIALFRGGRMAMADAARLARSESRRLLSARARPSPVRT